jgi:hypothetical protein
MMAFGGVPVIAEGQAGPIKLNLHCLVKLSRARFHCRRHIRVSSQTSE